MSQYNRPLCCEIRHRWPSVLAVKNARFEVSVSISTYVSPVILAKSYFIAKCLDEAGIEGLACARKLSARLHTFTKSKLGRPEETVQVIVGASSPGRAVRANNKQSCNVWALALVTYFMDRVEFPDVYTV